MVAATCGAHDMPSIAPTTTTLIRLGLRRYGRWLEPDDRKQLDITTQEALDPVQQLMFVMTHQGQRTAPGPSTSRATDTVDIVLGYRWQLEIDHLGQICDIQSPCSDIGRHQRTHRPTLEVG